MQILTIEFYARMYCKAIVFHDQEIADEIALEPQPGKQKALGRGVRGFDNEKWNAQREKIVEEGNWWKFTQSKEGNLKTDYWSRRRRLIGFGEWAIALRTRRRIGVIGEKICSGRL